MAEKLLKKEEVGKLYNELVNEYKFYAPTKVKGNIAFKKISNAEEIDLNYLNSKVPPKDVLFPQKETIFEYIYEGKDVIIEERKDLEDKLLIFGVRPCDAYSFKLLEDFFASGDFQDDVFLKKRENATIIGIGCNSPRQSCFCTSVGGHPFQKESTDIFLSDLGDKFLVEAISEKGKNLLTKLSWLTDAKKEDLEKSKELAKQAEDSFTTKFNFDLVTKVLDENFEHPVWQEISESCIGCSSCTFLCPTCTCFDVIDENDEYNNRGRRIRIWDTCQSCLYTLETSGHNPRPEKIQRCRNRIMHKFSYYPSNYDCLGCVGCGRCIIACPVNNELRLIIDKILEIEKKEEGEKLSA
ncbi:MAG: 4Fe-4S dicluster domain-containing protein [Candidatus Lokiarchaeota archaeon]|nr:4Fe-4S dicluster domain-containing protein [Candidatus Lokiarchaeota archaeon]